MFNVFKGLGMLPLHSFFGSLIHLLLPSILFINIHAVLLNDTNLMEILFSEEFMIQVMGVLECMLAYLTSFLLRFVIKFVDDPDISEPNRMKHREFLTNNAIFKQVCSSLLTYSLMFCSLLLGYSLYICRASGENSPNFQNAILEGKS